MTGAGIPYVINVTPGYYFIYNNNEYHTNQSSQALFNEWASKVGSTVLIQVIKESA